jgi:hypothetical protein
MGKSHSFSAAGWQLSLDFSQSVGYLLCANTFLTGLRALTQHFFADFYEEFQVHSLRKRAGH